MRLYVIIFSMLASFCLQNNSCRPESKEKWTRVSGPDDRSSVVFFFKKGASYDERDSFYKTVISYPDPNGKGYYLQKGISSTLYVRNSGYEGYAIQFSTEATQEQREELKRKIRESQITYRVYENEIPSQITDLSDVGSVDKQH